MLLVLIYVMAPSEAGSEEEKELEPRPSKEDGMSPQEHPESLGLKTMQSQAHPALGEMVDQMRSCLH